MIDEKCLYTSLTKGTAPPCKHLGMFDVLDATECKSAAISLNLVDSNYKPLVPTQYESDRPYGCRVQSFGDIFIWINTKESSPSIPSESHIVICKTSIGKF